ncbi:transcriptional regulator [Escherichia coli]|uniref:helix-turn-helix domain-containing protein n=1 Tax=Enterobacteriaceae TaxID=543 RepID=UPI000BA9F711|nr:MULTISPECIES: helix-turn-helix domain-containing protein [Enterobacteriaceae]HDC4429344.1 XRE family transcriptional regulator [Enterobacter asburiae]EFH8134085.1 transcriptional regulator [Escherichia coli]EFH9595915.1 transcriptional regulator [Escherichia coli]EFL9406318.1 transcriptional regulator [Escherichia coli]EHC2663361.1 transcriptional regulator [Escherichia coli]
MQNNIGSRLREERERLGLSQQALGEIGGVKKLTQLNYEKGDRAPDTIYLTSVAEAGVDIVYVLTGQRIPSPVTVTPQNEEEKKLLENYRAMDEAARLNIQAVGAAFAQSKSKVKTGDDK